MIRNRYISSLFCLLFLCFSALYGADVERPNMEQIKSEVMNFNSSFYYPKLIKRYTENDTTLTRDEYKHLYYGYTFQEGYNPYRKTIYSDEITELSGFEELTQEQCDSLLNYTHKAIADFPFDIRQINLLAYAYRCKGDEVNAVVWETKLRNLLDTILASGDGSSEKTAWWVIHPTHEYSIVTRKGLLPEEYKFKEPFYDYIKVKKNGFRVEGYYFNVSRVIDIYNQKYK